MMPMIMSLSALSLQLTAALTSAGLSVLDIIVKYIRVLVPVP